MVSEEAELSVGNERGPTGPSFLLSVGIVVLLLRLTHILREMEEPAFQG